MAAAPIEDLPFQFVSGHLALDFTNTVSWGREGLRQERLGSYAKLIQWAEEAKLPLDPRRIARKAARRVKAAEAASAEARVVRAEIHQIFLARTSGGPPPAGLLDRFNRRLAASLAGLQIHWSGPANRARFQWRLRDPRALDSPLLWVLWESALLLASNEPIKRCANPDCGWLFLDRSRRGNRRWCDMAVCGARSKARRYYRRRRLESRGRPLGRIPEEDGHAARSRTRRTMTKPSGG